MKRDADVDQDPLSCEADTDLNLDLFRRIVAKLGSPFEGERVNALEAGNRMLAAVGMRWEDLVDSAHQKEIAVEAAFVLQAELNELRARLAEYERSGGGSGAVAVWQDVPRGGSTPQEWARWVLAEHAAKRIYLNRFECEFLPSIAGWVGSLTERQQPVFDKIRATVTRRSGKPAP